jgi:diguanylate cyclase (GGDEF)-like protein
MNKQILVVDDSVDIHPLIAALLSEEPVDVHSATDPVYGLTLAASLKPDLILLDVDMPVMDGYEFCRRLKADANLLSVPVVFLTAKGTSDQKVRGLHLGAVDYVTKPFSPGELLARVVSALRTQAVIADLEDRSLTDTLTGLGNRKMFGARLRAEVSERARSPKPLTCTYIDVDGITAVNKYYGEPFGDQLLVKVAETIRESYRPEDVACRMRDDDFAVLTPDTSVADATELARGFKDRLSRAIFSHRTTRVPVTCGVGIAGALDAYDQSMYERAVDALERPLVARSDDLQVWEPSYPPVTTRAA